MRCHGTAVEIGSHRGIAPRALSCATFREVVAVDPYVGAGGHLWDLEMLRKHTAGALNIKHLRMSSDEAFAQCCGATVSPLFIEVIHEYVQAWYNFAA